MVRGGECLDMIMAVDWDVKPQTKTRIVRGSDYNPAAAVPFHAVKMPSVHKQSHSTSIKGHNATANLQISPRSCFVIINAYTKFGKRLSVYLY